MLIIKTFSYDPDQSPKVHEWCKKMGKANFSDCIRKLIESDLEIDLLSEIKKLNHKIDNINTANLFAEPDKKSNVIKFKENIVNDINEESMEFNKNSLKNRYKL